MEQQKKAGLPQEQWEQQQPYIERVRRITPTAKAMNRRFAMYAPTAASKTWRIPNA